MKSIHIYSPARFPNAFSDVVSDAAMTLPPLTRPQDEEFLLVVTRYVVDAFWQRYVFSLPEALQEQLRVAMEKNDDQAIARWFTDHADFEHNAESERLGAKILSNISRDLPSLMQKEYPGFTASPSEEHP